MSDCNDWIHVMILTMIYTRDDIEINSVKIVMIRTMIAYCM